MHAFLLTGLALAPLTVGAQGLLHTLTSPNEEEFGNFGYAVSGVPDVDGDGRGDVLIGAIWEDPDPAPEYAGRAYVFSGATGALLHTLVSPNEEEGGLFGRSVAGVPDVDGDGRGDLLMGASGEGAGGRVYLFSGATGALLQTLENPVVDEGAFGSDVEGVPDVDGDGMLDFLIGDAVAGEDTDGRAYVFSGATGALLLTLASPNGIFYGQFGRSVSGVPDADGDGLPEFLIGAHHEEPGGQLFSGRAYVFRGADGTLLHTLESPVPNGGADEFGYAVSGVPDVDGDGKGDLLIGARLEDSIPLYSTGQAHVFSGATGALIRTLLSPNEHVGGFFGNAVAAVPDVDGDGVGDHLVGAAEEDPGPSPANAGRAYAFSGATGAFLLAFASPAEEEGGYFGHAVAGVDDVDGDGTPDFLIGAYAEGPGSSPEYAGRAHVFSGVPPLALSAVALNSPVPLGRRLHFGVVLTNLTPDPIFGDLTLEVTGPDGATYARLLEDDRTLGADATRTPEYGLPVYDDATLGVYVATVTALEDGVTNLGEATFTFEVVAQAASARSGALEAGGVLGAAEVLDGGGLGGGPAPLASSEVATQTAVVPNPASDHAVLALTLSEPTGVRAALHDMLGREVAAVDAGPLGAGPHRLIFDLSSLPAGVYVWHLTAGTHVESGRLTVSH